MTETKIPSAVWFSTHAAAVIELHADVEALGAYTRKVLARHDRRTSSPEWLALPEEERAERAADTRDYLRELRTWYHIARSAELLLTGELRRSAASLTGT